MSGRERPQRKENDNTPPSAPPRRGSPRWPWVLLGTGLLVGGLVAYSPTLFGGWLLSRYGEEAGLSGGTISGPLWAPKISNAAVKLPGLKATAGEVKVTPTVVDREHRTITVKVAVADARLQLKLADLMASKGGSSGGKGGGWKVVLGGLDVQRSRMAVDGSGVNVPDLQLQVQQGSDGRLNLKGQTSDGALSAQVKLDPSTTGTAMGNSATLDFRADARIARHYWKGVTGGQLTGRYVFGDGPVRGDIRLEQGTLQVPEAQFVQVTGISGTAAQRGDTISYKLAGRGWDGPVTARGGVDLKAKHWTVTADATPTMQGLARALNTTGQGELKLRVTAGGWTTTRVKAYAKGHGAFGGLPFEALKAEYTFLNRDGGAGHKPILQTNDIAFSAVTKLAGRQNVQGRWAIGRKGRLSAVGTLAGSKADVSAQIDAANRMRFGGQVLGGPLAGTFNLKNQQLTASLEPRLGAAHGRVALQGKPDDLLAEISDAQVGPFPLSGQAKLSRRGLQADFGTLQLNLDQHYAGTWQVRDLKGGGITASGRGQLDAQRGDLSGQLALRLPGVAQTLSGSVAVNASRQSGQFEAGAQRVTWEGDTFGLRLRDLPLSLAEGVQVSGDLKVNRAMQAYGTLSASGQGYDLKAVARGQSASWRGTAGGFTVLADSQLQAPYHTTARLAGTDIRAVVSLRDGLRFTLHTPGEQASGVLNGDQLQARGRVNLAALRPLLPLKDLSGRLDLNLAGLGGSAQLRASSRGATVSGQLIRRPGTAPFGQLLADLTGSLPLNGESARARLQGQVYPQVRTSGQLNYLGQTLRAEVFGPYDRLQAALSGRTAELSFSGVSVPGQALNVRGSLTPTPSFSGTWGDLRAQYDVEGGQLSLRGSQVLTAFGETGRVQGAATWAAGFKGQVDVQGALDEYRVRAQGPWNRVNVLFTDGSGLRGLGTASLPEGRYNVDVKGPLTVPGQGTLLVDGHIQGTGNNPQGTVLITDRVGGRARVNLRGFNDLDLGLQGLTLAGQRLQGQLHARRGLLSGRLNAGPFTLLAQAGRVRATGQLAGHRIEGQARLTLPATLSDLDLRVSGPYLSAVASGPAGALRGRLWLKEQRFGPEVAQLVIPAQTFPLSASLLQARARVGNLSYQGGQWTGDLGLGYALLVQGSASQRGQLRLAGSGTNLIAQPSGPLQGKLELLPAPRGQLSAALSPYLALLPEELRGVVVPGQLLVRLDGETAELSLRRTRYQNRPLHLQAQLDWRSGLKARGLLTHPGTRLPLEYDGHDLTVSGARLSALALRPWLPGASGSAELDLSVPGLQFAKANGAGRVDVSAGGQRASGSVTLRQGQLSANLRSDLGGQPLRVRGALYPQANAVYTLGEVQGRLQGDATSTLNFTAKGQYQGQSLDVVGRARGLTGQSPTITVTGVAATGRLNLGLRRAGASGLAGWQVAGRASWASLKTLTGSDGHLSADLGGTLADLRLRAKGEVAGIAFSAPASFRGGVLRLNGASAGLEQGQVVLSGPLFPQLKLSARADLKQGLPGRYTGQIGGSLTRPSVALQGRLETDGSIVTAQLLSLSGGQWQLNFAGLNSRLAGTVRQRPGLSGQAPQWSADVGGQAQGRPLLVQGELYPRASAQWRFGDLRGQLAGDADQTLTLRATGELEGRSLNLTASGLGLSGPAPRLNLSGSLDNAVLQAELRGRAGVGPQEWPLSGQLTVPDLRPLTGQEGQLSALLSGTPQNLQLLASGVGAGMPFSAPATLAQGKLRVDGARAQLQQGEVVASGTLFPQLQVQARAELHSDLPGQYTAQIGGRLGKPDVSVQGQLSRDVGGWNLAGTRVSAHLLGKDWKAQLEGAALSGVLRGQLGQNAAAGLLDSRLRLNTAYREGENDLRVGGVFGWNAKTGWRGKLRGWGDAPGGPLDLLVDGRGVLSFTGTLGQGEKQAGFSGNLPADLPLKPAGQLTLNAVDIGAFWGRAGQLRATGQAQLGGDSWSRVQASFQGRLQDSAEELSGDLHAGYRAGDVELTLTGQRVNGVARLRAGRYQATLKSETLRLARLLSVSLDVDALTFAGTVQAQGNLTDGPQNVLLQNVALRGEQGEVGPFTLFGSAEYRPAGSGRGEVLKADLRGSLRGGLISARGELPAGLNMLVSGVPTHYREAASLGKGKVDGELRLTGALRDPALGGHLNVVTDELAAKLTLTGRASDPRAHARVNLLGSVGGTLYAEASRFDFKAGRVQTRLYGSLHQGDHRADLDLGGSWPNLSGTVRAEVAGLDQPLTLTGNGTGLYVLNGGSLGGGEIRLRQEKGWVPELAGQLNLRPLTLLDGASGDAQLEAVLGGPLNNPTFSANLTTSGAGAQGVTLLDSRGVFTATRSGLTGRVTQAGQPVVELSGSDLTLSGLTFKAAGSTWRASGKGQLLGTALNSAGGLNGVADLALTSMGDVRGNLKASYRHGDLGLSGTLAAQGLNAELDLGANPLTGWRGGGRVTGGVLTQPATFKLRGDWKYPLLSAEAGLLGAGARLVANQRGAQLRLLDGPGATASGLVQLQPTEAGEWRWSGGASLSRPELSLSVAPTGPLSDPQMTLSLRRGEWRASGTASRRAAQLEVGDGEKTGRVNWNGQTALVDLPGLSLARLAVPNLNGVLSAKGQIDTTTRDGNIGFSVLGVTTPQEIPYLGLTLAGDVQGQVTVHRGVPRIQARADLNAGTLSLQATQFETSAGPRWRGDLSGDLTHEGGQLKLNLRAGQGGLFGSAVARDFQPDVMGRTPRVSGQVEFGGQTFALKGRLGGIVAGGTEEDAVVTAEGGLADLWPQAQDFLALKPTGEGYQIRARLNDLELSSLKLARDLSGKVNGEINLNDGGGTFFLQSPALNIGPKRMPARIAGTKVAGDWRLNGYLGEAELGETRGQSTFTAGFSDGQVFGRAELQALPLGAIVAAVSGTNPGEGVVTGVARFRFPIADPLAGNVTVVAERIRVSATRIEDGKGVTETLVGTGSLDMGRRELRNVNVQLSGAGTWDVRGQYTHDKVDVQARFNNTTFTPVLQLIPGLIDLDPSLKGSLQVGVAGSYDRPRALIRAENLSGSVAGLSVSVPSFAGDLPDSGAFSGGGRILTGGSIRTDGQIDVKGQLTLGKLSGTQLKFAGLLAPEALGSLPNTTATISQAGENSWRLDAQSLSTNPVSGAGVLSLSGSLSPRWDLTLNAQNYNLPLAMIYAKESALTGTVRAVDDGQLIHVTGNADFARLTLGRVNAPVTIPAPGESTTKASGSGQGTVDFSSPLPPEYTTFAKPTQPGGETAKPALPFLQRLVLDDITVRAPNGIRVDENLARAEFGTTGLTISGTGANPRVSGEIASQRGTLFLRENEFTITESTIRFDGQGMYPTFHISARGVVPASVMTPGSATPLRQNVPITLTVSGDFRTVAGQPNVLHMDTKLSCTEGGNACINPVTGVTYGDAELYAIVATGVPDLSTIGNNLAALGTSALQTALNVFVLGEIERNLARALGVDVFRLTPALTTDGGVNATLTVGSYLTRDLFVQYQVDLRGQGLINATYSTPDGRFTFRVSTPLSGLNIDSIRPSFNAAYNVNKRASVSVGVESNPQTESTRFKFGVTYRIGAR